MRPKVGLACGGAGQKTKLSWVTKEVSRMKMWESMTWWHRLSIFNVIVHFFCHLAWIYRACIERKCKKVLLTLSESQRKCCPVTRMAVYISENHHVETLSFFFCCDMFCVSALGRLRYKKHFWLGKDTFLDYLVLSPRSHPFVKVFSFQRQILQTSVSFSMLDENISKTFTSVC